MDLTQALELVRGNFNPTDEAIAQDIARAQSEYAQYAALRRHQKRIEAQRQKDIQAKGSTLSEILGQTDPRLRGAFETLKTLGLEALPMLKYASPEYRAKQKQLPAISEGETAIPWMAEADPFGEKSSMYVGEDSVNTMLGNLAENLFWTGMTLSPTPKVAGASKLVKTGKRAKVAPKAVATTKVKVRPPVKQIKEMQAMEAQIPANITPEQMADQLANAITGMDVTKMKPAQVKEAGKKLANLVQVSGKEWTEKSLKMLDDAISWIRDNSRAAAKNLEKVNIEAAGRPSAGEYARYFPGGKTKGALDPEVIKMYHQAVYENPWWNKISGIIGMGTDPIKVMREVLLHDIIHPSQVASSPAFTSLAKYAYKKVPKKQLNKFIKSGYEDIKNLPRDIGEEFVAEGVANQVVGRSRTSILPEALQNDEIFKNAIAFMSENPTATFEQLVAFEPRLTNIIKSVPKLK